MESTHITFQMVFPSILFVVLTLLCYTLSVWVEHKQQVLQIWHIILLVAALICNITAMALLAHVSHVAGKDCTIYAIAGAVAILLLCLHCIWSIWTKRKGEDRAKRNYNRFNVILWFVWLVAFILMLVMSMR